jgi:hypothetical protein
MGVAAASPLSLLLRKLIFFSALLASVDIRATFTTPILC